MASSSCHVKIEHDVFISFRGTDVRHGLLSHLKKELLRAKIGFYVDDKLERGDEISSSLLGAIEGSQILLVIFSKDYASSKWCLDELVKIMECEQRNKQIVMPIFYKVDPSYVRNQKQDYGVALAEHEKKEDMVKVQNWSYALNKAAQLSGFHYPLNSKQDESDLVDGIVKDVSKKLKKIYSTKSDDPTKSNGLVGIDQNIAWIKSLLTTESEEVQKLGIWGMGGIGKTTIARVVFDTFYPQYDSCCFMEDIRDDLKNQLSNLREKLVYELLGEEYPYINGRGKVNYNKRKLKRMKVFIVLDNVDSPNLLKDFLEPICFGLGSVMIVTSRDKQVFTVGGFHKMWKVKELNIEESLKLFCINAFNESKPRTGYEELSKKVVAIAKGNPLALKVFGSYFHSKCKDTWECALKKLTMYPNKNIQSVLKLSYDGLDDIEKKIFLDIAFFLKEEDKDYVIEQLDAWGFHGACGIEALQDKALITISNDNRIQMHDLIQEMGWEIVRQESPNPHKRSRLRDATEVYDVLKNNKRADSIEGILVDVSQSGKVALNVDSLTKMHNLRLLKFYSPSPIELPMRTRHFVLKATDVLDCSQILHAVIVKKLGIPKQVLKFQQLPLTVLPKSANSNECDGVLVTDNVSGSKQLMQLLNLNIGQLMHLGNEVHIKFVHNLVMDGCLASKGLSMSTDVGMETLNSSSGLVNNLEFAGLQPENVRPKESSLLADITRQLNLGDTRMELLKYSTGKGNLSSLERCSDIDGLKPDTPPEVLRSTYYHRLLNLWGQDGRKTKLLVLFDGFRYSERISFSSLDLRELSRELLYDPALLELYESCFELAFVLSVSYTWGLRNEVREAITFVNMLIMAKLMERKIKKFCPPKSHHRNLLFHFLPCAGLVLVPILYAHPSSRKFLEDLQVFLYYGSLVMAMLVYFLPCIILIKRKSSLPSYLENLFFILYLTLTSSIICQLAGLYLS